MRRPNESVGCWRAGDGELPDLMATTRMRSLTRIRTRPPVLDRMVVGTHGNGAEDALEQSEPIGFRGACGSPDSPQAPRPIASTSAWARTSARFGAAVHRFARESGLPQVDFAKEQRKDDVMHEHPAEFTPRGFSSAGRRRHRCSARKSGALPRGVRARIV
jgi:hypothetical protein